MGTRETNISTETSISMMTTIRDGSAEPDTSTESMAVATSVHRDGIAAIRPDGVIAECLPAKPRSTAVELTFMRDALTTTIRTRVGKSSFVVRRLRFTPLWTSTEWCGAQKLSASDSIEM